MYEAEERVAYRPEEVGPLLGLGRTTVFSEIKSGRLESLRVGRCRIIPKEALRRYIETLRTEQPGAGDGS